MLWSIFDNGFVHISEPEMQMKIAQAPVLGGPEIKSTLLYHLYNTHL